MVKLELQNRPNCYFQVGRSHHTAGRALVLAQLPDHLSVNMFVKMPNPMYIRVLMHTSNVEPNNGALNIRFKKTTQVILISEASGAPR